jgi:hypothetical protein
MLMFNLNLSAHPFIDWLLLFACLLLIGVGVAHLAAWLSATVYRYKARRHKTIIAEYEPLADLRPHELGYLYDNRFADNELFAVLLELRQKDAVKLIKPGEDIIISLQERTTGRIRELGSAEQAVLGVIAGLPTKTTDWRRLSSRTSERVGPQAIFESSVYEELHSKGYLDRHSLWHTLHDHRTAVVVVSLFLTLLLVAFPLYLIRGGMSNAVSTTGFQSLDNEISDFIVLMVGVIIWPLLYYYCHALAYVYFRAAELPVGSTAQLRLLWPRILGYREYIAVVEANRLKADPDIGDAMMATCVALGCMPTKPSQLIGYDPA